MGQRRVSEIALRRRCTRVAKKGEEGHFAALKTFSQLLLIVGQDLCIRFLEAIFHLYLGRIMSMDERRKWKGKEITSSSYYSIEE